MSQEVWINDILNSTDGMTKVVPNDLLFSKIQEAIKVEKKKSNKWIWAAAASFVFLFSLNSFILFSKTHQKQDQAKLIIMTISKNNQLY